MRRDRLLRGLGLLLAVHGTDRRAARAKEVNERRAAVDALKGQVEKYKMEMQPLPPMQPQSQPSFQMVRVVNHNAFAIVDRWDGVPYTFLTDTPLNIPPDAAAHFFGWPAEPEVRRLFIAKRNGWNTPDDIKRDETGKMRWEKWVDSIEISPVHFDIVQRADDDAIPADCGEDAPMAESGDGLPMPMAPVEDHSSTRVGVGRRHAGKAPRRVNV
jgi:hypothetical protein